MAGMRKVPDGIRRVRLGTERPAAWYAVWSMQPDRCVLLGHTRRLERHLRHRAYPVSGTWGREFSGWVRAAEWLAEQAA